MGGKTGFLIEILGNSSGGQKALHDVERSGEKITGTFSNIQKAAGIAGGVVAVKFAKDSFAAFEDAEKKANLLSDAFARYPALADSSAASITKLAGAIANKTAAEDDSIVAGAAQLAQFGLTGKQLEATTPLLVDYARKTGQDIPTAALALGKAFEGKTRALLDLGIKYKSTGDKATDFTNITELLRGKVGGFAQGELTTTSGKIENLKNHFGNLQESVGHFIVGGLDFLAAHMNIVIPIVGTLTAAYVTYKLITVASTIVTALFGETAAASWAAAAGPIALVVAGIVGLGFVIWKFRDIFVTAFNYVRDFLVDVLKFIANIFLGWADLLLTIAAKAFGWIPGIGPKLRAAKAHFEEFRDGVNASLDGLKDHTISVHLAMDDSALKQRLHELNAEVPSGAKASVPHMAQGGIVRARPGGQLVLVGEGGQDEAVVPLEAGQSPAGGSGNVIHIENYHAHDEADIEALMRRAAFAQRAFG